MTADVLKAATAAWAAKDLPLRILAEQTAELINCTTEDLAIIVSAGKLRALGKPRPNAVKYFSAIEVIALGSDPDWLDDITKILRLHWQRKNARRNCLQSGKQDQLITMDS